MAGAWTVTSHEEHMARARELARRSANGEFGMHEHTPAEPCTSACPIFAASYTVRSTRARKRWVLPRLRQLVHIAGCAGTRHQWGRWRVELEDEDWYDTNMPEPWAVRVCSYCQRIEQAVPLP